MRTTKQILRKLNEEKMLICILKEQLEEHDGPAGVYQDVSSHISDAIQCLENAIDELDDIEEYEDEQNRVLDDVCHGLYAEGGTNDD